MRWKRQSASKNSSPELRRSRVPRSDESTRPAYSYYTSLNGAQRTPSARLSSQQANSTAGSSPKRSGASLNRAIFICCAIVLVVCLYKLFLLIPSSKIIVVKSEGIASQIDTTAYAKKADSLLAESLLNRLKITLNTNGIAKDMQRQFPELSSVVVAVPLIGNRPIVYISPGRTTLVLDTGVAQYGLSAQGYVLAKLSAPLAGVTRLRELSSRAPTPGKQYLAGSIITYAVSATYQLQKAGYSVSYLDLPSSKPYELNAYITGMNYYIRFNMQDDVLQQSGAAIATLQQLGAQHPNEYLDVRTLGRVYYK